MIVDTDLRAWMPRRPALVFSLVAYFLIATIAARFLGRVIPNGTVSTWLFLPATMLITVRWGRLPGIGALALTDLVILTVVLEPIGLPINRDPLDYGRLAISTAGTAMVIVFVSTLIQRSLARERTLVAQAERARAQQRQAELLDTISDAFISTDRSWRYAYVNANAERLLRSSREELLGRGMLDIFPKALEHPVYQRALEALHQQQPARLESYSSLSRQWFDVRIYPSSEGVSFFFSDITEQKRAEHERLQLAAIVESSEDAIIGETLDGVITSWNAGAERLYGYAAAEAIGQRFSFLLPSQRAGELEDNLRRLRRGERIEPYQTQRVAKGGRLVDVSIAVSPIRDSSGTVAGASAVARDVSEQMRAQRALAESEEALRISRDQLQAMFQSVADGVMVQDASGSILYANDAAAALCGYSSSEALLATPLAEVLKRFTLLDEAGQPLPPAQLPAQRAFRGERAAVAVLRSRARDTGAEQWAVVRARPVLGGSGTVQFVVSAFQDISALKQEEVRVHFLDQATAVLASSLDYRTTLARVAQLAVPALADWAAVNVVEPDGAIRQLAVAHVDPAKAAWVEEISRRYPLNPDALTGVPHVIRTGQSEFFPTIPREIIEAAAADEELRQIVETLSLTSALTVPLQARGRTLGAISFVQAESGRHYTEADLRLAEELAGRAALAIDNARLFRDAQEALQIREEFLSTVSHDLRTPLTTIRGLAQLLTLQVGRLDIPQGPHLTTSLANVERASRTMGRMIDDLLDVSRIESGRPLELNRQHVDLVSLCRQVAAEQQQTTTKHQIAVHASETDSFGMWDPTRIERVLINLLSNAIKYSPDGGPVTISVGSPAVDGLMAAWAEVRVEDGGMGIPAGDLPRIFDRFHRAQNVAGRIQGLGIGLAGARQIVEQHGGDIHVESEEGHGAVFVVRLPRDTEAENGRG